MVRILSKLNRFCSENKIEYILTGTAALQIMGLPTTFKPGDIDIKLITPSSAQLNLLLQQQDLSGLNSKDYTGENNRCISFYICGCKINALIDPTYTREEALASSCAIEFIDTEAPSRFIVHVQKVCCALSDKMALYRIKDKEYLLDVIRCITSFIR